MHRLQRNNSQHCHGAAYILVLSLSLLLSVMAIGAALTLRMAHRESASASDWDEAGVLAFSAVEDALSTLNAQAAASPTAWRTGLVAKAVQYSQSVGRGTLSWELTDDVGGTLSSDYMDPVRIYGIGTIGGAVRVYSVQVMPTGSPLDVLRTALHAGTQVTLNGNTILAGGPASSNANINMGGQVIGSVEALSKSGGATPTGTTTVPAATKTMPQSDIINYYLSKAVAIPTSGFSDPKNPTMQSILLSPSSNPYGAVSTDGVYSMTLQSNGILTINNCRILGTLVIVGGNKSGINVTGPVLWEPNRPDYPSLIFSGQKSTTTFKGSTSWLSESANGVNFNPTSTPYQGVSNSTMLDDYPPQYRGLFHIIDSSGTVNVQNNAYFSGCVLTDGTIATNQQTSLINNQSLYSNPPLGYSVGNALTPMLGTWKWDTLP